jgi:UDP-glucose 4-epimerase
MSPSRRTYDLVMRLWPWGKAVNRMGNLPLLRPLLRPWFSAESQEAIIVPVQEAVVGTESVVLPFPLLNALVERASARVVLNECLCRRGEGCQAYPRELGCLFLGIGAAAIDPGRGRPVDSAGALAHVQRAMAEGLVPLIVHASFDAWLLDIPYRRMLAVCFCCDCCCTVRHGLRLGPPAFWDTVVRLPGLAVTVGAECTGCGLCVDVCHVEAIRLDDGLAQIGEACKGCGRCAAACPVAAIRLEVGEEVDVLGQLLARIEQRTDIGPAAVQPATAGATA